MKRLQAIKRIRQDIGTAVRYYQRMCLIGTIELPIIRKELHKIKQMVKDEELLLKREYSKLVTLKMEIAQLTKDRILKESNL